MTRLLIHLILASLILFGWQSPAQSEEVDMDNITCQDFMELDLDDLSYFFFWLEGYKNARSEKTLINTDNIEKDLSRLLEACAANGNKNVLKLVLESDQP